MHQEQIQIEANRILSLVREIIESDLDLPMDSIDWRKKRRRLAMLIISEVIRSGNGDMNFLMEVRNEIKGS
jgi:hypothetical protein